MNKLFRATENISLGFFVSGGYSIMTSDLTFVNLYITIISAYVMVFSIIFQEE